MTDPIWLNTCFDCYYFVEYNTPPDDYDTNGPPPMHFYRDDTQHHFTTGDGTTTFSREPCDGCGNTLAGSRHEVQFYPIYDHKEETQ